MKKCTHCEINYIKDNEEMCESCKQDLIQKNQYKTLRPIYKYDFEREAERKLSSIGASWLVCYLYNKYIDDKFNNYKLANNWHNRKTVCENNEKYHWTWLTSIVDKNLHLLDTNNLNVSGKEIHLKAYQLMLYFLKRQQENL